MKQDKFLVNVLGIIYDAKTKRILIGKRMKDPYVRRLSWVFPGGTPKKNALEASLKYEIKVKTNVDVEVRDLVFARIPPERKDFLLIYFLCEYKKGKAKAGEKFVEAKWIKPMEVKRYFTTSIHPGLLKILRNLK